MQVKDALQAHILHAHSHFSHLGFRPRAGLADVQVTGVRSCRHTLLTCFFASYGLRPSSGLFMYSEQECGLTGLHGTLEFSRLCRRPLAGLVDIYVRGVLETKRSNGLFIRQVPLPALSSPGT